MTRTNREMVQIFFYSRLPFLLLSFVFTFHCAKFPWQYVTKSAFIFNFLPGSTLYCQWMAELLNDTVSALAKRYKRKIFGSVRTPRDHPDHGRGKKDPPPFSWHASELLIPHREVWLGNSIVGLLEYWIKNNHCGAEGSMQSRILSSLGNGFMDKMEHIGTIVSIQMMEHRRQRLLSL
ncbi:uncharacterized protein LOC110281819 isoform X3 [Arachis duranensis]|uniref:Uncharacterized protein LOC110281819 isoform X3 n=1 Tax=Arachis duranensis TaxID=130453 RepID=A0A9C6TYE7_ARADU|nr:uncharacterized protein LOC110281819 isoform X3 [Arachis duranensis]